MAGEPSSRQPVTRTGSPGVEFPSSVKDRVKLRMCQTHKAADVVGLYMAPPENAIMRAAAPRGRSGKPSALMLAQ